MGRSGDKADAALELAPSSLWAALRRAVFRGGQGNRGSGTRDQTVAATQFLHTNDIQCGGNAKSNHVRLCIPSSAEVFDCALLS